MKTTPTLSLWSGGGAPRAGPAAHVRGPSKYKRRWPTETDRSRPSMLERRLGRHQQPPWRRRSPALVDMVLLPETGPRRRGRVTAARWQHLGQLLGQHQISLRSFRRSALSPGAFRAGALGDRAGHTRCGLTGAEVMCWRRLRRNARLAGTLLIGQRGGGFSVPDSRTPSASVFSRSISALTSAPRRSATLVSHSQMRRMIAAANEP